MYTNTLFAFRSFSIVSSTLAVVPSFACGLKSSWVSLDEDDAKPRVFTPNTVDEESVPDRPNKSPESAP